jgi:phosphotransferase family enzyme
MIAGRPKAPGAEAAIAAWASMCRSGAPVAAAGATTLKPPRGGSAAYRLAGAGPRGRDVIAKWTWRETIELEANLYAEVLPELPVATVSCYGSAPDGDGAKAWLFLDDAGGEPYSPRRPEHRRLAARWLGAMHTALPAPPRRCALPARDTDEYRAVLVRCGGAIAGGLRNPAIGDEHRPCLRSAARRIETLLEHWPELERLCAAMPRSLVHGDFVPKNVRVCEHPGPATVQAFDWENAAWGLPAIDLTGIDLVEYGRVVRGVWPAFGLSDLRTFARVGRVLWFTWCLAWESWAFTAEWVWGLTKNLPIYERELGVAMRELGWS